jgi:hypothetical protein
MVKLGDPSAFGIATALGCSEAPASGGGVPTQNLGPALKW